MIWYGVQYSFGKVCNNSAKPDEIYSLLETTQDMVISGDKDKHPTHIKMAMDYFSKGENLTWELEKNMSAALYFCITDITNKDSSGDSRSAERTAAHLSKFSPPYEIFKDISDQDGSQFLMLNQQDGPNTFYTFFRRQFGNNHIYELILTERTRSLQAEDASTIADLFLIRRPNDGTDGMECVCGKYQFQAKMDMHVLYNYILTAIQREIHSNG
jgi:hypothetical protein